MYVFTFISIYFMLNLLLSHKLLSLQFLLGHPLLLHSASSGLGTVCSCSVGPSQCGREGFCVR